MEILEGSKWERTTNTGQGPVGEIVTIRTVVRGMVKFCGARALPQAQFLAKFKLYDFGPMRGAISSPGSLFSQPKKKQIRNRYSVFFKGAKEINVRGLIYQDVSRPFGADNRGFVREEITKEITRAYEACLDINFKQELEKAATEFDIETYAKLVRLEAKVDTIKNNPDNELFTVSDVEKFYEIEKAISKKPSEDYMWIEKELTVENLNSDQPVVLFESNNVRITITSGALTLRTKDALLSLAPLAYNSKTGTFFIGTQNV